MHRPAEVEDVAHAELIAWLEALPATAVLTGLTAAAVWGLWLPPLPAGLPVFVELPAGSRSVRAGVRVHRCRGVLEHVERQGLRLSPVPATLLACARTVSLLDLVVLVDSALHRGLCTRVELEAVAGRRRAGSRRLREAILWCDARSESPWETLLRILHLLCDVPVEPQAVLLDGNGRVIARADLLVVGTRTLQEYDGSDHLDRARYRKDRRRDTRLVDADYIRHGWTSAEVLGQAVAILREADRALGREHDPTRVRPWHQWLKESLFSGAGTADFCRRIGLTSPGLG